MSLRLPRPPRAPYPDRMSDTPPSSHLPPGPMPYAITLGAAVWPHGVPSPTLRRRATRAGELYLAGKVAKIIATGGLGQHPPTEADVTRTVLLDLGIPSDAILLEDSSTTTLENLRNAARLLPDGTPAIIVSDVWHLPRARLAAARLGLTASTARASLAGTHPGRIARAILRETLAFFWYLVRPLR